MGVNRGTAVIVAGLGLAGGVGYLWWRSRQSASKAATTTAATSTTGCTDSAGNSVACPDAGGVDQSGELSVIQTELETLATEEGDEDTGDSSTTTTGSTTATVVVPRVTGLSVTAAVAAIKRAGLVPGPQASKKTGTVTSQTPRAGAKVAKGSTVDIAVEAKAAGGGTGKPPAKAPAEPGDLRISGVNSGGFTAAWRKPAGATVYQFRITYQEKLVHSGSTPATRATVSGLQPDHTYTFHVKACNKSGCSSETNGPPVKTAR
jgi:hypothetical protein